MAGFKKAEAKQAALKLGFYGPPGSGKSFTSLLIAEGLVASNGKRIAYVDTERGTDFYCKKVEGRAVHPEAFDFDALYTKSLTEALEAIKALDPKKYGVIVLDSITHLWEAARAAYSGKTAAGGQIPFHAWGKIKKPYKELMTFLLGSPYHVIICGRQGVEYETNEETEELKAVGLKMKAEGETPYEPHVLIRLEALKPKKTNELATIVAYVEKDRTGLLSGRNIVNPCYESIAKPMLHLLGHEQATMASEDETAAIDSEALQKAERDREAESAAILNRMVARIALAENAADLKVIGKEITPTLKAKMLPQQLAQLRDTYAGRLDELE